MQFDRHTEKYPRKKKHRRREDDPVPSNDNQVLRAADGKSHTTPYNLPDHLESRDEGIENTYENNVVDQVERHERRRYKHEYARRFHAIDQSNQLYHGDDNDYLNEENNFNENNFIPEESLISGSVKCERSDVTSRNKNNYHHDNERKMAPLSASFSGYDEEESEKDVNQPEGFGGNEPGFWNPGESDRFPDTHVNQTSSELTPRKNLFNKFLSSFRLRKSTPNRDHSSSKSVSQPNITAKVLMLDGEEMVHQLCQDDTGQTLFDMVCNGLDMYERDYFGLTYVSSKLRTWFWLDLQTKISKQLKDGEQWFFYFQVKFYPPEPSMLQEDLTRYQLALQVRQDVYTGKLPCSWVTQALLGSFMVQSEIGDFDPQIHVGLDYLSEFEFVPTPTPQLLQKIAELHKTHVSMKPNQADIKYLETAKRLELYGVDLHPARDSENVEIYIGVGFHGVVIYRDRLRIGRFAWPKVLRISYKKNNFFLKIRPDYSEPVEAIVGFRLLNPYLANRLWKTAVEHHGFFRLKESSVPKRTLPTPALNKSHYRFTGRTFFQYRTVNIDRPNPEFNRSLVKRHTCSMPTGLNTANNTHTLNRSHPRDMTVGRSQQQEQIPPKLTGSMQIPVVHDDQSNLMYGGTQRNGSVHRMHHSNNEFNENLFHGRRNSNSILSDHNDFPGRRTGGSMVSGQSSHRQSHHKVPHQVIDTHYTGSDLSATSPVYANTRMHSQKSYDDEAQVKHIKSGHHIETHRKPSINKPPPGGVPVFGGVLLNNTLNKQSDRQMTHRQKPEDYGAKSRHRRQYQQNENEGQEIPIEDVTNHQDYEVSAKPRTRNQTRHSKHSRRQSEGVDELL